jgi:hypothetical protein
MVGQDTNDKVSLAGRVGTEVGAVLLPEAPFQRLVFGGQRGISPQGVAEREPLAPEVALGLG